MTICFASHNKHKIEELNQMLHGIHNIVGLSDIGVIEEIAETGTTFSENSRIKAKYIFEKKHLPVFADDSGLCVDSLNGEPGVFSARYSGPDKNDQKNIDLLLSNLQGKENRHGHFETVITFINEAGQEFQFHGQVDGVILDEIRGEGGFGYDPIFQPNGYDISFAEMSADLKNSISHRGIAVKKLINHLTSNG